MKIDAAWVISDRARECLQRCDLFQDLNTNQLKEIAALVEEHSLEPDELLLREGEEARYLFVIVEGRGIAKVEDASRLVRPRPGGPWGRCGVVVHCRSTGVSGLNNSAEVNASRSHRIQGSGPAHGPRSVLRVRC